MALKNKSVISQAARALAAGNSERQPPMVHRHRPTPQIIRLSHIELDPNQPRKDIGDIADLVTSIREYGLIEPLVVQPIDSTHFRVIAGERRFHACRQAGLEKVPCMVRTPNQQQTIEIQLIENLHRKDLDPFEEAEGYARLKMEHNYTDAEIASKMARARTTITETLGLVRIPAAIRQKCRSSDIRLSRDTLYLIARQKSPERMRSVLDEALAGVPQDERRNRARTGKARSDDTKPKWAFRSVTQNVTVVVQSHDSSLDEHRRRAALEEALSDTD